MEVTILGKDNAEMISLQGNYAIKIRSVQAASLYRVNNNYKSAVIIKNGDKCNSGCKEYKEPVLDYGNAVISSSLFSKYVRGNGVTVNQHKTSLDFVLMKFDRGVDEDDSDRKNRKPAMPVRMLRDYYYENGATIVWKTYEPNTGKEMVKKEKIITYKMFLRSTGKAKEGQCLFIREELHR